jgi:tetratricopeptide (TPR) repeat protein
MSLSHKHFATRIALLAALLAALATSPSEAADPFYVNLLRDGKAAQARGELDAAIWNLRVACFGMLDEPALLAEGLVQLSLAQSDAGSAETLTTVDRLLDVETQFGGYTAARLSSDTKGRFENLIYRRVDPARLAGLTAFAALTERRERETMAAAGPDQLRMMLEDRLAGDPSNAEWLRQLANLETAQGRPAAAVTSLSALLALSPNDPLLRCERFRTAVEAGRCDLAVPDVTSCPAESTEATLALPLLSCITAQSSWQEASDYLQTLPAAVRSTSKIRKAEKEVNRQLRTLARMQEPEAVPESPAPTGDLEAEALDISDATASEQPAIEETTPEESAPADDDLEATLTEPSPQPDPCERFRRSARNGACTGLMSELATCSEAALERAIAPKVMKCYADASEWHAALSFAQMLPPQVRGLSKIRKIEGRATKQVEAQTQQTEEPASNEATAPESTQTDDAQTANAQPANTQITNSQPDPVRSADAPTPTALDNATRTLASARTSNEITRAYALTSKLALDYPTHPQSNLLAAQGAYRAAQWDKAVAFFKASGGPTDTDPLLLFYYAVSLYETGNPRQAATLLDRALPRIRRTPFVDSYVARINTAAGRN